MALDLVRRPLARADAAMNRLYGWRGNPLYHTGVLTVSLLAVVLVTGIYLLIFYRIGSPWASVARITNDLWLGAWMRSLHRYASDAAVAAAVLHAVRMWLQRRSWGARTLAWVSGLVLFILLMICGWTGYVMVWDVQGLVLAREGARLFDALPLFSEPIERAFDGSRPLPGAFFFLNLFAHVALPVGLGLLLWLHVSRVARPVLVPPRRLGIWVLVALGAASAFWPVTMAPAADLLRLPGRAPYDVFYSFFLPLTMPFSAPLVLLVTALLVLAVTLAPLFTRPKRALQPPPSVVDERLCTGCEQCSLDCPYEAIARLEREDNAEGARSRLVARVDPALCTSCGICAGSCAPMGVGPAGRTGRDQLADVRGFVAAQRPEDVVVVACARGAGEAAAAAAGVPAYLVSCAGNLHTSTVEYLLRSGAAGVLVASCPPRDCWNREGAVWAEQRLFHDREAELQPRVDKRRVRLCHVTEAGITTLRAEVDAFRRDIAVLAPASAEPDPDVGAECEAPVLSVIERNP